ncbi:MAG: ABC transporter ATP-binding protein [Alphaproteobacteria bacterium]|nr:ABC transporter ATP-binding protein [Alphaproteobacteria bacterium]
MEFPKTVKGFYWLIVKKFPLFFGAMFLAVVLGSLGEMVVRPITTKMVFSIFDGNNIQDMHYILSIVLGVLCLYFAETFIGLVRSVASGRYVQHVHAYKHMLLTKRIFQNDGQYFIDNPSGQLLSWSRDVANRQFDLTYRFWAQVVGVVLGFVTILGIMMRINIWILLVTVANGVIRVVWQYFKLKPVNRTNREISLAGAKWDGVKTDGLDNALSVKLNGNSEYESQYIYDARKPLMELNQKWHYYDRVRWVPTGLLSDVSGAFVILLSVILVVRGQMNVSDLAFVLSSYSTITLSFSRLNTLIQGYSENSAIATVAWEKLNAPIKVADKPDAKNMRLNRAPAIDFDDVVFGYGNRAVLKDFDLHIKPGEKIGIVGLSGAGKSTLCNLMLRMYDVDDGAVLVNGTDIRDVRQDSLRQHISYVPQESVLFNRTILENIRYARPNASRRDVITAAKRAHIHEFIMSLPNGYDTLVGNRGIKLSGGQRQRIAIARALLKNAPILVLDEATSALDSQNELFIQKSLKLVMNKKTTVAIAHRLSTLRNMDRIVVMSHGRIVEAGSHNELLRRGGAYKKLWNMQTNGFIG